MVTIYIDTLATDALYTQILLAELAEKRSAIECLEGEETKADIDLQLCRAELYSDKQGASDASRKGAEPAVSYARCNR